MKAFLEQQAMTSTNVRQSTLDAEARPFNANRGQTQQNVSGKSYAHQLRNAQNAQRTSQNVLPCLLCHIKHPIFSCQIWKSMNINEREIYQRANKLCIPCVQPMHGNTPCWGNPNWIQRCPTCWNDAGEEIYHNSTLCRRAEAKKLAQVFALQIPTTQNAEAKPSNK